MRRLILAIGLLVAAQSALAQYVLTTYRLGNVVIQPGDTQDKVLRAKRPTETVDIVNAFGVKVGEQHRYRESNKTVAIEVRGGMVQGIIEFRD